MLPLFQFAKLSRDLVIPGGMRTKQPVGGVTEITDISEITQGADVGGATQLDDDELEGGLCWKIESDDIHLNCRNMVQCLSCTDG